MVLERAFDPHYTSFILEAPMKILEMFRLRTIRRWLIPIPVVTGEFAAS